MQSHLTMASECCLYTKSRKSVTPLWGETEAEVTLESQWLRFESLPVRVYFVATFQSS